MQSDDVPSPGSGIGALPPGSYEILEKAINTMVKKESACAVATARTCNEGQISKEQRVAALSRELRANIIPACYEDVCEGLKTLDVNATWWDVVSTPACAIWLARWLTKPLVI